MSEQVAHLGGEVLLGIFQQIRHPLTQAQRPSIERDPALQQETTDLIDDLGAVVHQSFAHPVQPLYVQLVLGLDGNEPHVVARYRFGNRLRIKVVVLVRLAIGFDELPGNQPRLVPLLAPRTSQAVRTTAGFDADQ